MLCLVHTDEFSCRQIIVKSLLQFELKFQAFVARRNTQSSQFCAVNDVVSA